MKQGSDKSCKYSTIDKLQKLQKLNIPTVLVFNIHLLASESNSLAS